MNYNEKKFLLSKFPQVELCYEKKLHNKVRNIDYYITIPFGKKYFAWFKNYNNKNYLFILEIDKKTTKDEQEKIRKKIHILFSVLLIATIVVFKYFIADQSVIANIFKAAGYTYGPLLGLYAFGLFTSRKVKDKWVPLLCLIAPISTFLISHYSHKIFGFDFGFFVLVLNGFLTFIGLYLLQEKES